jgi:FkbM family methyltransferase
VLGECAQKYADIPRISYAQHMEDILIDRVFHDLRRTGTFMDIGANHPYIDNNSYFFYLRGWRCANVEPSPYWQELFRQHRPRDLNLGVAVSDEDGELPFFEVWLGDQLSGLSTLSRDIAESHRASGYKIVETRVPVRTVGSLIKQHGIEPPGVMSIDVESHEAAVIRGVPWETWRPGLLVIESTAPLHSDASHRVWEPTLLARGYLFAAFNGVNRFYLREDLSDRLDGFATPVNFLDNYTKHDLVMMSTKADNLAACLQHERAAWAAERARREDLRQAWEFGRVQASYLQAVWEQDRDSFAKERTSWTEALAYFERTQAHFREQEAAWQAERSAFEAERNRFEAERARWEAERAQRHQELIATLGELRPYRIIDHFGVVQAGYGLAKRVKRRLVS